MQFNPLNFINNLQYMGLGMATIFIIIAIIMLAVFLLDKIFLSKN